MQVKSQDTNYLKYCNPQYNTTEAAAARAGPKISPYWEEWCRGRLPGEGLTHQLLQQAGLVWSTGVGTGQSWYQKHQAVGHPCNREETAGWG